MKKFCIMLVLLLSLIMSGCGGKQEPQDLSNTTNTVQEKISTSGNDRYDINKASYAVKNVKINYPQLSNLSDSIKQNKINELIKTSALEVLDDYKDDINSLNLNMDFEIKYQGTDFLSIEYLGLAIVKGAAYPVHVLQTANVDMVKERILVLSDVVTVNDSFIEKFQEGQYKAYSSDLNLQSAGVLKDKLSNFSSQDLMESLKQRSARFYFTKDALGVSVEVAHAAGDHLEMEMPYKDLSGLLLVKPDPK